MNISNVILDQRSGSDPLGGLRGGAEVKIHFFSEYVHVAYQIKGNDACSNMIANIMPADTPLTLWGGVKGSKFELFQNMVMLHMKLKGSTNAATL